VWQGVGVKQLGNVLKAIAVHDPDVGYCQVGSHSTSYGLALFLDALVSLLAALHIDDRA